MDSNDWQKFIAAQALVFLPVLYHSVLRAQLSPLFLKSKGYKALFLHIWTSPLLVTPLAFVQGVALFELLIDPSGIPNAASIPWNFAVASVVVLQIWQGLYFSPLFLLNSLIYAVFTAWSTAFFALLAMLASLYGATKTTPTLLLFPTLAYVLSFAVFLSIKAANLKNWKKIIETPAVEEDEEQKESKEKMHDSEPSYQLPNSSRVAQNPRSAVNYKGALSTNYHGALNMRSRPSESFNVPNNYAQTHSVPAIPQRSYAPVYNQQIVAHNLQSANEIPRASNTKKLKNGVDEFEI